MPVRKKGSLYAVVNKEKYIGNPNNVVARSSWETVAFQWLDRHPDIAKWSSEEIPVKYYDPTSRRKRTYWPDLYFETADSSKYLVEIKPSKYTHPPKSSIPANTPRKKKRVLLYEQALFAQNIAKWNAAREFAEHNNISFEIWTEEKIEMLGA